MAFSVEALEVDRRMLWGLCYRMTGNAADADDLVQETYVRAIANPPKRSDRPARPWLIRVAMNLSLDLLRKRRRRRYAGEWLPSPVPTDDPESPASFDPRSTDQASPTARYEMIESVSFAFLIALEALTPIQRAVLLLRDVFDYSTEETAEALDIGGSNVKVTLHRARRRMRDYDKRRVPLDSAQREATRRALEQFLLFLQNRDIERLEKLLVEDVVSVSDGGGEVAAAMRIVAGRDRVLKLVLGLAEKELSELRVAFQTLNGLPAAFFERTDRRPGAAPRFTVHFEIDESGRIRRLDTVLAPKKLTALA